MFAKFLIAIGLRSRCCGAKIEAWHAGKDICSQCHKWLRKDVSAEAMAELATKPAAPKLSLKRVK